MKKNVEHLVTIAALTATIGGLEYYFFRAPSLAAQPAQASGRSSATLAAASAQGQVSPGVQRPEEKRLKNVKQLTFGGENAEAYWSFDGKQITLQSTRDNLKADQIFIMNADGSSPRMVSTGKGRTTCSYFLKDGQRVLFASTHLAGDAPPPAPDFSMGYVWAVYPSYDIFTAKTDGTDIQRLTDTPGYDAEATVSPDGKKIVFTSMRDGDLDLYVMDIDGKRVRRLTNELGYDGGAFFSPDGKQICYRAHHPKAVEDQQAYKALLDQNLVKPSVMELYVMNADGSDRRQITKNGAANFCPFFTPDGKKLIFSSNQDDPKGRNFDLYLINLDGTGQEQVTFDPTFDGFPMFSPDGKKLVWASNRNAKSRGETNIFLADWAP
jgi:TolB protein